MKKTIRYIVGTTALLIMIASCKKYLDINSDPDTTQLPSSSSVLPQCLASIPTALQSDGGLYVAKYVQNWLTHTTNNQNVYDLQGYSFGGGTMAATWQMTYYALGNNINYIIESGLNKKQYEFVGVALALKAWSFQHTTDYNADIPFHDAFIPNIFSFHYDPQEVVYKGVDSLCRTAIMYLDMAIANPTGSTLAKGDFVYNGDVTKWKKFAYGILARNWHHLTNKSTYNADSVIKYCDNAMSSVNDDFCVPFDATVNNNSNYFGTFRDNMPSLRQSNYIVKLLDGTILAGSNIASNRDPRMAYMLSCSSDTTNGNGGYRGVDPGVGDQYSALNSPSSYLVNGQPPTSGTALTNYNNARKKVGIAFADSQYVNTSASVFTNTGKYLFQNKAVFPIMTYAEMQFIKAEASLRRKTGPDVVAAYPAYINGIKAHFDFINRSYSSIRGALNLYTTSPISAATITKYLASANVAQIPTELTVSDVMLQKYIALWGWGFFETWVDMRRYHYNEDPDPLATGPVYQGFVYPTPFYSSNGNKPVYRVRPHFTSEYTYNLAELQRLGILTNTYHTTKMWFSEP
ncbi:MAG TPA: SusD/RagB family nutrient-binding outer membrane lipoprotein [Chitinophagaceae bacterium]